MQQLLGEEGLPLSAADLLHLATRGGRGGPRARRRGRRPQRRQAVRRRLGAARAGSTLDVGLRHAHDAEDALAKVFALGCSADLAGVWVGGDRIKQR